jgi:hypothetical protein
MNEMQDVRNHFHRRKMALGSGREKRIDENGDERLTCSLPQDKFLSHSLENP